MQYTIRLYYNTGFNAVNIPDGPALLNSMTYQDFPSQDLVQNKELSTISVFASYDNVVNADYLCVFNSHDAAFYAIDGVSMSDPGTAVFSLIYDEITTAGGISAITILDGMTERHHVAAADDTFGAFTEEDPYLVASKPLEIVSGDCLPAMTTGVEYVIAESTASLTEMGYTKDDPKGVKVAVYESGQAVKDMVMPETATLTAKHDDQGNEEEKYGGFSTFGMLTKPYGSSNRVIKKVPSAGSALYVLSKTNSTTGAFSSEGINALRRVGAENAVLNSYVIPADYIYAHPGSYPSYFSDTVISADGNTTQIVSNEHIDTIIGIGIDNTMSNLPFEYETVKNKRVLYGSLNKYGIAAVANGNVALFNPEEIYHSGDTNPTLEVYADPRPTGQPIFRYKYLNGNDQNVYRNAIIGEKWQSAPSVYKNKSGSLIDEIRLNASQDIRRDQYNMGTISNITGDALQTASGFATGRRTPTDLGGDLLARGISAGIGLYEGASAEEQAYAYNSLSPYARRRRAFEQEMAMENLNFAASQVVAPTVAFPRTDGIRDYVGNNCFCFRYRPSATDLAKQDKILTMYGYRDTAPLTSAMFTNRSKFNYIKASGVSVKVNGINASKRLADGISAVLNNGIRIWHVAPDPAIYTNGANV